MGSHRRALLQRAITTAAVVVTASTTAFVGTATANHPEHDDGCRAAPEYPPAPNPYVEIVAEDNEFDEDCLRAPANRQFRIYLENRDPEPHNISIYSADPSTDQKAERFYRGKAVKGPGQEEYLIHAMPPGNYWFQDDKVTEMNGVLKVPEKKK